jgi:hypothetical protein
MLEPGDQAPDFTLPAQNGDQVTLYGVPVKFAMLGRLSVREVATEISASSALVVKNTASSGVPRGRTGEHTSV